MALRMWRWDVQDGPSKFDLFDALQGHRRTVTFTIDQGTYHRVGLTKDKEVIEVTVTGLDWNDDSGHNWIVRGEIVSKETHYLPENKNDKRMRRQGIPVPVSYEGHISTQNRKGWIEINA